MVYVDPRLFNDSPDDANPVLVTHSHNDHYSRTHVLRASNDNTVFLAPPVKWCRTRYSAGSAICVALSISATAQRITHFARISFADISQFP